MPEAGVEVRRVAASGEPLDRGGGARRDAGAAGRRSASGSPRYWPVRAALGGALLGVGTVVFEVTDRRAAERALRTQTDRYETLLAALSEVGEGMVVIEDGRCVYANHAFEQLSGYTFPELTALESLYEIVEPDERAEAERRVRLRSERDLVDSDLHRPRSAAATAARVTLELAGVPLEIAGPPVQRQLVVVVRDITARRRAEAERERLLARSALLAEASALFDQSLDEERTLRSIAELCVRDLADTCVVVLGAYPGPARRRVAVARDPAARAGAGRRGRARAAAPAIRSRRCMRTGRPFAGDGRVVVPLSARGRVLGALSAGFDALEPAHRDEALALLEDLGRRAALALDNARLYAERTRRRDDAPALAAPARPAAHPRRAARRPLPRLGRGDRARRRLLRLLRDRRRRLGARDRRRLRQGRRGGRRSPRSRATPCAPPCCTRGARRRCSPSSTRRCCARGSTTASARSCTRRSRRGRDGCEVVLATGGHPLPLVIRAGGAVEQAGEPGTLLGIVREPHISEARVELGAGDALVLYTDGVIEASPADDALGPERLEALLRTLRRPRRGRDRRGRRGARRSPSRTAGCATTWRSSCCARRRLTCRARGKPSPHETAGRDTGARRRRRAPHRPRRRGRRRRGARRLPRREPLQGRVLGLRLRRGDRRRRTAPRRRPSSASRSRASTPPATPARASPPRRSRTRSRRSSADRIVVFSHPEGDRDYREDDGLAGAQERFGIPVEHAIIGR